jgi:hypothetical protein
MTVQLFRKRIERLEAFFGPPIGKNVDHDRQRRRILRSRSYSPGLTSHEQAELVELDKLFEEEDRAELRKTEFEWRAHAYSRGLGDEPLTAAEELELAELNRRFPDAASTSMLRELEAWARAGREAGPS